MGWIVQEMAGSGLRIAALLLAAALTAGCSQEQPQSQAITLAEQFIDAFYAWDPAAVEALVVPGEDLDRVAYYQGWAEAANYQVLGIQPCMVMDADGAASFTAELVQCAVTVSDDFGQALGYTATDTFSLAIADGKIVSVAFAGDDPPIFDAVFAWMAENRPEVLNGPCLDMFEGGTTPGACARAVADAARTYAALIPSDSDI